ncbi:monothiol glutaredoxin-s17-like [Stylonychia lemnae]|uniref:Monothiol glutaredoxin-s17-like n=1 Tax=Stylonychia lemnae TaxID=5949 RepID=A0A078A461_STYLE|nr:monothiol glutaredoxin-s17-like [Stylonychia lemnae]|eukprot:CDW76674.1 monothiol glutaredoxin-s17-like [Stylonychia lemnae]
MIPTYQGNNQASAQQTELIEIKDLAQLETLKKGLTDKCIALLFWADWHQPCHQLRDQFQEMIKVYKEVRFTWCNSDECQDLIDKFNVNEVPTLALIHPHKMNPEVIQNPSPDQLNSVIETQNEFYQKWFEEEKLKAFREIDDMVKNNPFFAFIKGSPEQPKCKFTRRLVEMFGKSQYKYKSFDILSDERIRQWLKFYSNWPTFPQIFLEGSFVGGVDIVTELIEGGEFEEMVPKVCKALPPLEEFQVLLNEHKVLALIQGSADVPQGENSQNLVNLLKSIGVKYVAIDLTQKEALAKALQEQGFNGSPTLYVNSQCLGDLDKLNQLHSDNKLVDLIPSENRVETLESRIVRIINQEKVMVFIKGPASSPYCGFSQRIVKTLNKYEGVKYGHFDILSDDTVREGLKKYSNWPTYPQLYVNGQLVGGIDIVEELDQENELDEVLRADK